MLNAINTVLLPAWQRRTNGQHGETLLRALRSLLRTFFLAASTIFRASFSFMANGFSTNTCLPALIMSSAAAQCPVCSMARYTMSTCHQQQMMLRSAS
jgi:hypothetical protein